MTNVSQHNSPMQSLHPWAATHTSPSCRPRHLTSSPHHRRLTKTHRPMPNSALRESGQWVTHHPWAEVLGVEDVYTKWHNFVATRMEAFNR
ncbi:hypothetical protein E2C01_012934 [Portunus trituberculatus]|uniref:Uncharacterized protein n=1 Tax=Portunus trituberculatus TaxID=210409 RepID=A0A5B7DFI3_PORTR|nr:hypothetical protein [Portunus trituberculatus]